jgi:phosphatidylinositol alpha-mannosyltransferase
VAEALACGTPVVTGDVGDRAAALGGGQAGLLVRPGDAAALAEGLLTVLRDPAMRARLASTARAMSTDFRWGRLGAQFSSVYAI